jgi:hypothetical protein
MKTTGLTLAEAVSSGRPFKFKGDTVWTNAGENAMLRLSVAIATDWEIQPLPPKQTWTREEVEALRDNVIHHLRVGSHRYESLSGIFAEAGL